MEYGALVDVYDRLGATASTLEKTDVLAGALADAGDLLPELSLLCRGRVAAPWEAAEAGVSSSLATDAVVDATGVDRERVEEWWRDTGDLGDAAARAVDNRKQATLVSGSLDVSDVYGTLRGLADRAGPGSQGRRVDDIAGLLADADPAEARYVIRTVLGTMRLGVGEGTVRDAVAEAFLDGSEESTRAVARAYEVTNDFRVVATTARDEGVDGLAELDVELFRPVKAMLARKAEGAADALGDTGAEGGGDANAGTDVLAEYKYDGVRAQIHVRGDEVRVFTRRLEGVTEQFPDVVRAVRAGLDADAAIVEALAGEIPVTVHAFDLLYADGASLLDAPLSERVERLEVALDGPGGTTDAGGADGASGRANADGDRTAGIETDGGAVAGLERASARRPGSVDELESFYAEALDAGHEGLVVKNRGAAYQPGSRVGYMRKLKPTMEPLDLVVVGAKWSEGRKSDWLGRLRLACWDADREELREVGRLFSGLTDDELREITAKIEPLIESVDGRTATLRPEVVIQVEYEEIQESTTYDSGYALRFPRFGGFREDLAPADADTFERVSRLYEEQ